jgi:hypothetical protein
MVYVVLLVKTEYLAWQYVTVFTLYNFVTGVGFQLMASYRRKDTKCINYDVNLILTVSIFSCAVSYIFGSIRQEDVFNCEDCEKPYYVYGALCRTSMIYLLVIL